MSSMISINVDTSVMMKSRNFDAINALIMQKLVDVPANLRAIYADYDNHHTDYLNLNDLNVESWKALSNVLTSITQEILTAHAKSTENSENDYHFFFILILLRARVDTDPRIRNDNLQYRDLVLNAEHLWKAEKSYFEFVLLNVFAMTQHVPLRKFLAQTMFQEEARIDASNLEKETICELATVVKQVHQRYENGIPGHFPDFFTAELLVFLTDLQHTVDSYKKQQSCAP